MPLSRRHALAAATALLVAGPAPTVAETDSAPLEVLATVLSDCSIQASVLDFGEYVRGQSNARDVDVTVQLLNCEAGTVLLTADGGGSGDINARRMTDGESDLSYQLYRNSGRTTVFGEGTDAIQMTVFAAGNPQAIVFARIDGGQNPPAGDYTDTVNLTISF